MTKLKGLPTSHVTANDNQPVDLVQHQRRCTVCKHPQRAAIEESFLYWRSPEDIAEDFHLADRSTVYRHAHATGLFDRRRRNVRWVLERILEQVDDVPITAGSIVRAALAYARINGDGEWVPPPTQVALTHAFAPPQAGTTQPVASSGPNGADSSRRALPQASPACGERSRTGTIRIATSSETGEESTH
jgi:hypothetical protein